MLTRPFINQQKKKKKWNRLVLHFILNISLFVAFSYVNSTSINLHLHIKEIITFIPLKDLFEEIIKCGISMNHQYLVSQYFSLILR